MKQFKHEAARLFIFTILSLAMSFSMRPTSVKAGGEDAQKVAGLAQQGAMTAMMLSAVDSVGSGVSCGCLASTSQECPGNVAMMCGMIGLNIASMILSMAQSSSAGQSKAAVADLAEIEPFDPEAFGGLGPPPSLGGLGSGGFGCGTENESKYLCDPNGLDLALNDLNNVPTGLDLTPDQAAAIEKSKSAIKSLKDKNLSGALAALDGAGSYADTDSSSNADGGTAGDASYLGDDGSGGTAGINSNYSGTASGNTLEGSGSGGKGFGPKGALLGRTEWNGSLDAIDPRTGKSLTLWQRATRRYLGAPSGKRGFTMARIEKLRKESTPEYAEQKRKSDAIKKAALERKPAAAEVAKPVILSPKALFGH
ncbi:hypothetical protein GW916_05325 [bacterium]|nr:hypothetical protein [bacterium]